jgi:hypothetical protein
LRILCNLIKSGNLIQFSFSTDVASTVESMTTNRTTDYNDDIDEVVEEKRLEELWTTPKFKTDSSKVDNQKYLLKYDDQMQSLLSKYDQPKTSKVHMLTQKLRYQNDFQTFLPPNTYINTSQPDLSESDRKRLIEQNYDTPKLKRNLSYVEMRVVDRKSSQSESFDDNNNHGNSNRGTINENLNFNDLDKLLSRDKEISFKFSSLNNLNQRLTSNETKC